MSIHEELPVYLTADQALSEMRLQGSSRKHGNSFLLQRISQCHFETVDLIIIAFKVFNPLPLIQRHIVCPF